MKMTIKNDTVFSHIAKVDRGPSLFAAILLMAIVVAVWIVLLCSPMLDEVSIVIGGNRVYWSAQRAMNYSVIALIVLFPILTFISAYIANKSNNDVRILRRITPLDRKRMFQSITLAVAYRLRLLIVLIIGIGLYGVRLWTIYYAGLNAGNWYNDARLPNLLPIHDRWLYYTMIFWLFATFIGWIAYSVQLGSILGYRTRIPYLAIIGLCIFTLAIAIGLPMLINDPIGEATKQLVYHSVEYVTATEELAAEQLQRIILLAFVSLMPYISMATFKHAYCKYDSLAEDD